MRAADGFHGRECGLLEDDDGRRLSTFMLELHGGVGRRSCVEGSAAKMSRMGKSLALKESKVLYSFWLREHERECEWE